MSQVEDPRLKALTAGHPHHDLLFRRGTLHNSQRLTKGNGYLNRLKLSRNLTEDHPTHLVVPFEKRIQTGGPKQAPNAKHKPNPLEVAYRAQPSRIFRAPAYERDARGLTPIERMLPHKVMQLETEWKTSDFQPKDPPPPHSNFGVQTLRSAHMGAQRNAAQIGYPTYQSTLPMDTSFNLQQVNAQPNANNMEVDQATPKGIRKRINQSASESGYFNDSTYFNSNKRRR
jgi:hypothetical protein